MEDTTIKQHATPFQFKFPNSNLIVEFFCKNVKLKKDSFFKKLPTEFKDTDSNNFSISGTHENFKITSQDEKINLTIQNNKLIDFELFTLFPYTVLYSGKHGHVIFYKDTKFTEIIGEFETKTLIFANTEKTKKEHVLNGYLNVENICGVSNYNNETFIYWNSGWGSYSSCSVYNSCSELLNEWQKQARYILGNFKLTTRHPEEKRIIVFEGVANEPLKYYVNSTREKLLGITFSASRDTTKKQYIHYDSINFKTDLECDRWFKLDKVFFGVKKISNTATEIYSQNYKWLTMNSETCQPLDCKIDEESQTILYIIGFYLSTNQNFTPTY